jgi:hypothetical protein
VLRGSTDGRGKETGATTGKSDEAIAYLEYTNIIRPENILTIH